MLTVNEKLLRRVEEAQLNSWPAPRTVLLDGWVVRLAGGYTNRANSATPLDPCRAPVEAQLAHVADLYMAQGQPALVRTRSFDPPTLLDGLRGAGWTLGASSTVLGATLPGSDGGTLPGSDGGTLPGSDGLVSQTELFEGAPSAEWRQHHARLSGADPAKRDQILATLAIPCAFAGLRADGPGTSFAACGLVGVHDGMACLHLIVTDPAYRRRGLSRRLVSALLAWARRRHGADAASLQVDSENVPALALYAGLGFDTVLFDYAYWQAPAACDGRPGRP